MVRLRPIPALTIATFITAMVVLGGASPALAHDPIFLTDDQTTPDTGPYLPDGSISWAIYGGFPDVGETRGFEFDLRDGDDLYIGLLIPNLEPELGLPDSELPYVELTMPDGAVRQLKAEIREVFDEPFSQTSYVTLVERKEPAIAGRHTVVVHSRAPSRFVVAVGEAELFFTPADRTVDRPTDFLGIAEPLNAWYQTTAGGEVSDESLDEVQVDVEAVEEELEALAEEAAAATTTVPDETTIAEAAPTDEAVAADEAAAAADGTNGDDGSEFAWVVPVAIVLAAAAGLGVWLRRRRSSAA